MLTIYNTLTKQKEIFKSLRPQQVNLYVCGMTVYDYCHIGHARVMVVFDMIVRYLRVLGYQVTYVRNITDIDDKIIQRAQQNCEEIHNLTNRFIAEMYHDADALGVLRPDHEPRATHSIPSIINMIQRLLDKNYAYVAPNSDVYYAVSRFAGYGKLSGKKLEELRVGARVEVEEAKQDPLDFVLWKAAKPGEPSWDAPWGKGRPGWHIECSAMSTDCLGNHFDIHGGGMDLQFPHHENEIAQSEAATGELFVNYWIHNGFVKVNEEKMSKSLGNFFTVREVLERYQPEVMRYFILSSHYRSPLNYADPELDAAKQALTRLYTALRSLSDTQSDNQSPVKATTKGETNTSEAFAALFETAMNDDFNTPEALAILFEIAREINRLRSDNLTQALQLRNELKRLGGILGLLQMNPEDFFQGYTEGLAATEIEQWINARNAARARKDWKESDRIRDELKKQGIALEDSKQGTIWRKM